ncbi:MAG: hypothetical protein P1V97_11295 [Planctomycetota bacterium]|nr:hypothetical protein [Planctomycetota bacterium]
MLRNVLATIFGLFVGMCVNMALIQLNTTVLYPMPEGLDTNDPAQFNAYLETLPALAFVVVMLAHLGQALVGGWVAARLSHSRPKLLAMIVGVFSLLGGIAAMMMFKGPAWMAIELPLYLVLAWLAGSLEEKRRAALSTAEPAQDA